MPDIFLSSLFLENQLFGQFMNLVTVLVLLLWCIPLLFLLRLYSSQGNIRDRETVLFSTILCVIATGQVRLFNNSLILLIPVVIIIASLLKKVK